METSETVKQQAISARILALVASGKSVKEAFDEVIGAGQFEALAGNIYDSLRARQPDNLADLECEFCGERPGVKLRPEGDEKYWVCFPCDATCPECGEIGTHSHACTFNDYEDAVIANTDLTYAQSMAWFGEVL